MKKIFSILSVLFLVACNSKEDSQKQNVVVVKNLFEHFNKHDWKKMANLYADIAEFKDPSFGIEPIKQTRQQTIDKYSNYQKVSPDINDSIVQVFPSGDKYVTVEFISTGTAPGGKKWRIPICTIFTIENGLITKDNTYYDNQ